jgi:hypothetical protein
MADDGSAPADEATVFRWGDIRIVALHRRPSTFIADTFDASVSEATMRPNPMCRLCWSPTFLQIEAQAVDSEVISDKPNCGDSTWQGDSFEVFLSPARLISSHLTSHSSHLISSHLTSSH